jgi:hypothetical protein
MTASCLRLTQIQSQSHVTTDGQSASLSSNKAPIWDLRPDFYYCQTVAGLLIWGALSDERTGLSFTIAPGPCQCWHFRVRLPWDSWPKFTVSASRLPFSSPPTTRRVTVEVFDPAFTRECSLYTNSRMNSLFITSTLPEYKSPCRTVIVLCYSVCCNGNAFINIRWHGKQVFACRFLAN